MTSIFSHSFTKLRRPPSQGAGSFFDRLVVACVRWRLHHDDGAFLGAVMLCLAQRLREQCEAACEKEAMQRSIARMTMQLNALHDFVNLQAGEAARQ